MENGPFIDDVPIKTSIYEGFSMAMLNNQRVVKTGVPLSQTHPDDTEKTSVPPKKSSEVFTHQCSRGGGRILCGGLEERQSFPC